MVSNIKMLNSLLPYTLELTQEKPKFKVGLREYLIAHTFLSISQLTFALQHHLSHLTNNNNK